jgi:hypothetical protein
MIAKMKTLNIMNARYLMIRDLHGLSLDEIKEDA